MPKGVYKRTKSVWNKGLKLPPLTEEHRRKISEGNKGKKMSEEAKEKIGKAHKGKEISRSTRDKLSNANKGQIPWMTGKHHSEETKKKIRQKALEQFKNGMPEEHRKNMGLAHSGEKCHLWKGGITPENKKIRSSLEYKL